VVVAFVLFLSPGPVAFLFLVPSLEIASFSQEKRSLFLILFEVVIYFF
jgi:hypothetical protein